MTNDLISREALMKFPIRKAHYDRVNGSEEYIFGVEAVLEYAENLPTVDAVEVVRCKDCLHYRPWLYGDKICALIGSYYGKKQPDDYCSRGRKRE